MRPAINGRIPREPAYWKPCEIWYIESEDRPMSMVLWHDLTWKDAIYEPPGDDSHKFQQGCWETKEAALAFLDGLCPPVPVTPEYDEYDQSGD